MNPWQRDVQKFQKAIGRHSVEVYPPDADTRRLRARLIREESEETIDALQNDDKLEVIDGICDLIYVALGTAESYQVDLEPFWNEVQRANMAKMPGGVVTINELGKVAKPVDWRGPEHGRVFAELAADPTRHALRNMERAFQAYRDAQEDLRIAQKRLLETTAAVTVRPSI